MKRITLIIITLCLFSLLGAEALQNINTSARPAYVENLIKIKLSAEAISRTALPTEMYAETESFGLSALDDLMHYSGGKAIIRAHRHLKDAAWEAKTGFDRWFLIRLDGTKSATEALDIFKTSSYIEDASYEYYAYLQMVPNDPQYSANWGHNNTGQGPGGGGIGFDSNAPEAWDQQQAFGSQNVIIAIVDSGVNYNHADLNDNCIPGYDYGSNDADPMDTNGHGSQCAGVAAAETNNGIGVAGVAGGCKILPVKVMNSSGDMTFTYITNGITHAADNNADIISMSLGAEGGTEEGDYPSCDTALYYAYNAGCTILAATANSNTSTISYPANHSSVISVGAASPTGQRKSSSSSDGQNWWGSNYGVNIQDDPKAVDIMAATILPATTRTGGYSTDFNGTSCATPYAAGVAALIKSKDTSLTPAQVREAIVNNATDMTIDGGVGWDRYTGYGMINANAALASILPGVPICEITYPEDNSAFILGSTINVSVDATDLDGTILQVSFYLDGSLNPIYTDYDAPYSWEWNTTSQTLWEHSIRAVAMDDVANMREASVNVMLLAQAHEGFESGMFDVYPWNHQTAVTWTVQAEEYYTGIFAAKAGTISHGQNTAISVVINVLEPGEISFFSKVSSEANYDYLRFFMDGVQQAQWSGNVDWARHFYPVETGTHTFTWTYIKDQGTSSGSDTAWLDHITFPPHNAPPYAPSGLTATALSPTRILLNWSDNSSDETEFYVERQSGSYWSLIDWTAANVATIVNDELSPETTYFFRVRASNANGESSYSNTASATTLDIACPDNVSATADANQVLLSWSAPAGGSEGYEIWRYTFANGNATNGAWLGNITATATSYTDNEWHAQVPGTYIWKVMAIHSGITSDAAASNPLYKPTNGTISGIVTNLSGTPIDGAIVSCGTLTANTAADGSYTMSVVPGYYNLTASHASYQPVVMNRITVTSEQVYTADFQLPLYTVATPEFTPAPGNYSQAVDIVITCANDGAEIRYTDDGSEPTQASLLYSEPIHATYHVTIKARAYQPNCLPSEIASAFYDINVAGDDPLAPDVEGISNIYPNPFGGSTNIRFFTNEAKEAYKLCIYNLKGELVKSYSGNQKGDITLSWNGRDNDGRKLATGIYFIKLQSGKLKQTRKVVLK